MKMDENFVLFRCNIGCAIDQCIQGGSVGFVIWETVNHVKDKYPNQEIVIPLPLSGQLENLKEKFIVNRRPEYDFSYTIPFTLNKDIWSDPGFPDSIHIKTEVYEIIQNDISIILFSNDFANSCSKILYPFFDTKGKDIYFYKQLLYQVDCFNFITAYKKGTPKIVHIHDLNNGYLMSALLSTDKTVKSMISIIDSKMFEQAIYEPLLIDICKTYGVDLSIRKNQNVSYLPEIISYGDGIPEFSTGTYIYKNYLLPQHLAYTYADFVTADSPGHFQFITSYKDVELSDFYKEEIAPLANPLIQSGHFRPVPLGLYEEWFKVFDSLQDVTVDKYDGFTFLHNARFDPFHKGQFELFEAIDELCSKHSNIKFILSIVVFSPDTVEELKKMEQKFPGQVEIVDDILIGKRKMTKKDLAMLMKRSDFTIAPSKNSLESFCFAIGECMLFGNIPLISDQLPLQHWLVEYPADIRDELSLPNVNGNEKNDRLVKAIVDKIEYIINNYTPEKIEQLRKIAARTGGKYRLKSTALEYYKIYKQLVDEL
jgi:glycosyltransferase involved in cell wall biosynthesis